MAKNSYVYFCSECGYESSKWMGQCPGCKAWNTFVEEKVTTSGKGKSIKTGSSVDTGKSPAPYSSFYQYYTQIICKYTIKNKKSKNFE